jgi:hypothetical protein
MRNLDSKSHLSGFVRFKLEFYSSFADTFSTASIIRDRDYQGSMPPDVRSCSDSYQTSAHPQNVATGQSTKSLRDSPLRG